MRHGRDPSEAGQEPRTRQASMPPTHAASRARRSERLPRPRRPRAGARRRPRVRARARAPRDPGTAAAAAEDRPHDRVLPELSGKVARDVAARHAEAEAGLLLPQHRLAVVANGMISTFSPGRTSERQRSSWKSAGRSSFVTHRLRSRLGSSVSASRPNTSQRARPAPRGRAPPAPPARATRARTRARSARGPRAEGRRPASTGAPARCGDRPRRAASRARTRWRRRSSARARARAAAPRSQSTKPASAGSTGPR